MGAREIAALVAWLALQGVALVSILTGHAALGRWAEIGALTVCALLVIITYRTDPRRKG